MIFRLTPSLLAAILGSITFVRIMGRGPLYQAQAADLMETCEDIWWHPLIYLSNYISPHRIVSTPYKALFNLIRDPNALILVCPTKLVSSSRYAIILDFTFSPTSYCLVPKSSMVLFKCLACRINCSSILHCLC